MAVKAIKYGMKGDVVANLQTTLNNLGYNLAVDGSFGPKTLAAVKDYQQKNGLTVDGMVGPQTQSVLFGGTSNQTVTPTVSLPQSDAIEDVLDAEDFEDAGSRDDYTAPPDPDPTKPPATTAPAITAPATTTPATTTPTATTPTTTPTTTTPATTTPATTTPTATTPAATTPATTTTPATSSGSGKTGGNAQNTTAGSPAAVNYPDAFSYDDFSYGDFSYGDYQASETVNQAHAALDQVLASQPGAYQSKWESQLNGIIDSILNRQPFSYDFNEDALYKQYAEQYTRRGKLAMQDTMGQAAAMTGGYGSSYASTAGNQAYQEYLSQLNEVIPELYGMALDRYQMEGQNLYNQYGMLNDQEQQDYGRYMDSYNQWLAERDYATGRYDSERNYDYSKYIDDRNYQYGKYVDDRNYAYGVYSDDRDQAFNEYLTEVNRAQFDAQYEEGIRQYNENMAFNKEQADISNGQWQQSFESKSQYEEAKASEDGSTGGNAALEHVASMSSAEIVETMQGYSADGDNTGLAAFLDDCVASGRLTEEQADAYYEKYRKGDGHIITDTTVPTSSGGGVTSSKGSNSFRPNYMN